MTVVVVGRECVNLFAVLLHRPGDQRAELLGRCDARTEHELVAHAALVLLVVEVDLLVLAHDRADGFSGRARDAAHQHRDLLLDEQLGGVLRVNLVVRLGVELDEPQLAAENAALGVDVVDGEFRAVDHGEPVDVDGAGPVEETPDRNLVTLGAGAAGDVRRSHRRPERLQRLSPVHLHGSLPDRIRSVKCGGPNDRPYLARGDLLGKTAIGLTKTAPPPPGSGARGRSDRARRAGACRRGRRRAARRSTGSPSRPTRLPAGDARSP